MDYDILKSNPIFTAQPIMVSGDEYACKRL